MNSKFGRFFYTLVVLILSTLFLIAGILIVALPRSDSLMNKLTFFIFENKWALTFFGLGLILIGILLFIRIYRRIRYRYVEIFVQEHNVVLDKNLIKQYLEIYWKEHFPNNYIPTELKIKENSIQIFASFPNIPENEQQDLLNRIKIDLKDIFDRLLGYKKRVQLIAYFQS